MHARCSRSIVVSWVLMHVTDTRRPDRERFLVALAGPLAVCANELEHQAAPKRGSHHSGIEHLVDVEVMCAKSTGIPSWHGATRRESQPARSP